MADSFTLVPALTRLSHRAHNVELQMKIQKLSEFIEPVKAQWQTENIRSAVASYSGFCEQLALDEAQNYLARKQADKIQDWGSYELDAEGLTLQNEMEERIKVFQDACFDISSNN